MEQGLGLIDWVLNTARHYLDKYRLISLVRTGRLLIHFGPWRSLPRFIIRMLRPVARTKDEAASTLLTGLNARAIAEEVRQNSVAVVGALPQEFVARLTSITDRLPLDDYQLIHLIDEDVRRLTEDPAIKEVLRAYFKCEPVLLESTLMITGVCGPHELDDQNLFHVDYAGWESLTVFVYLSDVTDQSSCHIVAKGSHRHIRLRDVFRTFLPSDEASRRFGAAIQPITGPAGTVFFENAEAFHRRNSGKERRVMLNLLYASHRSWFSRGRTSRQHMDRRARVYSRYQAARSAAGVDRLQRAQPTRF